MAKKTINSSTVHQPHDKLVKKMLSNPDTARDILSLYLPEEVLQLTDLSKLSLQRDSFIDDEHRTYAVDLLYKTSFKGEDGYIWILLEHQRKSDYWMPVRIFKYIAIIWDHLRKSAKSTSIPLVYPIIIYNGDKSYDHSLTLSDLIEPTASKEIFKNLFSNPFCLVDLTTIPDESLRKQAQDKVKGIALLMVLKHVYDLNLQIFFDQILVNVLKQLDQVGDRDELIDVLYYLLNEAKFLDEDKFWSNFNQNFSQEVEDKMKTIAQKLEARGEARGKEIGAEEGKVEVAQRLLKTKSQMTDADLVEWIHSMTGLSIKKIKELQKKH